LGAPPAHEPPQVADIALIRMVIRQVVLQKR
jgi:hypothetical protein